MIPITQNINFAPFDGFSQITHTSPISLSIFVTGDGVDEMIREIARTILRHRNLKKRYSIDVTDDYERQITLLNRPNGFRDLMSNHIPETSEGSDDDLVEQKTWQPTCQC